jgi:hypothetical protein
VLSEGLRSSFGSKNCWVLACDSYFNTMAIGARENAFFEPSLY